jgi:cytochrome c oxidase accessory protein FixG
MVGFSGTRQWVYVQSVKGKFTSIRRWTFLALHLVLFVTPWLHVGGRPALLFDLQSRQLFVLGAIFTASDTIFLLVILLFLAFTLFFATSLFGRLWCGYACPQTVFLEWWIRPIEKWIEGDRSTRLRRERIGPSFDMVWRKVAKWGSFLLVAFVVSMAFMSYFAGAWDLWTGQGGTVEYALVGFFTFVWFFDFAWFREQFCNYLCPYARFQGALTDNETIQISYLPDRGEPRGGKEAANDGRCIDCGKCVIVCPAGIDIRDGFQLECIACARCIDACTGVMEQLGHPTLVAYTSVTEMEQGKRPRLVRGRSLAYAALLVGLVVTGGAMVVGRVPFEATVNRAPGSLFTIDADGYVRNTYLLKVTNNDPSSEPVAYRVRVEGLERAEVVAPPITLGPSESRTTPLVIRVPLDDSLQRTIRIRVYIASPKGELVRDVTFKTGSDVGAVGAKG